MHLLDVTGFPTCWHKKEKKNNLNYIEWNCASLTVSNANSKPANCPVNFNAFIWGPRPRYTEGFSQLNHPIVTRAASIPNWEFSDSELQSWVLYQNSPIGDCCCTYTDPPKFRLILVKNDSSKNQVQNKQRLSFLTKQVAEPWNCSPKDVEDAESLNGFESHQEVL